MHIVITVLLSTLLLSAGQSVDLYGRKAHLTFDAYKIGENKTKKLKSS